MSGKAACIYTPELLGYNFGHDHPFNSLRLELWWDLLQSMGLVGSAGAAGAAGAVDTAAAAGVAEAAGAAGTAKVVVPRMATREELLLAHDSGYLEAVELSGRAGLAAPGAQRYDLGTGDNPVFPGMHEATALVVGATVAAVTEVMGGRGDHALNMAGGLHHARRDRASGFCIYNDVAVAIACLRQRYGARVAYVDMDAHHGDGVQWAFYDDPEVLTISQHESGRYLFPGTGGVREMGENEGYGYSINLPMQPYTGDDSWIAAADRVLPAALRAFQPDVIISQHGCDGHYLDPLTHMTLTTRTYQHLPELVHRLAHEVAGGRWIATGGGGYDIWRVVPRAWTLLWGEMAGLELPQEIPEAWREKWRGQSPVALPTYLLDQPGAYPPMPRMLEAAEQNALTVDRLERDHPLLKKV